MIGRFIANYNYEKAILRISAVTIPTGMVAGGIFMFDQFRYHEPQLIDTFMGCIMGGVCGLSVAVLHPIVLPVGGIVYGIHKYRVHRFHAKTKGL